MIRRIFIETVSLQVIMAAAGAIVWDWQVGLSVVIGSILLAVNLHFLIAGVDSLMLGKKVRRPALLIAGYTGRVLLIMVVFFAIIHFSFLNAFGVLAGFAAFIMSGMLESLLMVFRSRNR